jgi:hypothetical protein
LFSTKWNKNQDFQKNHSGMAELTLPVCFPQKSRKLPKLTRVTCRNIHY